MWLLAIGLSWAADSNPVQDQIWRKLASRDAFEGCQALSALGTPEQVRDALLVLSAAEAPAWVPMRAASCVVPLAAQDPLALAAVRGWMTDPAVPGLALVVVNELDQLPEPLAKELAVSAVDRMKVDARFARRAPAALESSVHASVRELSAGAK